ncbi:hypothetical protein CHF27_011250 [Romboutsia maritimum]|uniref:Uncharacterized protein n=1 Tax=Romboutsia maritimum TaxID=2020948 RepID=A0A371IQZ5_9FIRM|nr:hypothetical protein [Romboutsia maritimum]RDY22888.1 hypothetical protein CHF27_011250 [Romboutsia maritimum]
MEKSSFFTSLNGDRKYKSSEFAEYFASFLENGIFPNPKTNLEVISNGDMTITVSPGKAWINGYFYFNTDNLQLKVDYSDSALSRIDRVVVKLDFVNREMKTYIKKGTFASSPTPPDLNRNADAYELGIATITVNAGVTSITQSNITDTRMNSDVCGMVNSLIKVDSTILTDRFEEDFNNWFKEIKGILGEDEAGNLLNKILEVENKVNNMKLEDTAITVKDANNHFTSDKLDKVLDELFTFASDGKSSIATVVGSPLLASDTFPQQVSKIQTLKNDLATNLVNKNVNVSASSSLNTLINKVLNIIPSTYKYATGRSVTDGEDRFYSYKNDAKHGYTPTISVNALTFEPDYIFIWEANPESKYCFTVYCKNSMFEFPKIIFSGTYYLDQTASGKTATFALKDNLFVNSAGFRLPVISWTSPDYKWVAIKI